jgi:hypothetical protein
MKTLALLSFLLLAGCGLNPKQMAALNGGMCNIIGTGAVKSTTTITAGPNAPNIDGQTCSITQVVKP